MKSASKKEGEKIVNNKPDIRENIIRNQMPEILDILLLDRTKTTKSHNRNIIWANDNYSQHGKKAYAANSMILPELITGERGNLIMPRVLKSLELKKIRTRAKAEVFTPTWIVKKQNDEVEKDYLKDDLNTYIKRKWLEVACGEAPYMATRYDMQTGKTVPLRARVGFVDRKLNRINNEVTDKDEWQQSVEAAFKSSFGFEWNGDSLLLARENLLYTYRDFYFAKWNEEPGLQQLESIAIIISYNVFQMDGLNYTIPLSEKHEKLIKSQEISLFNNAGDSEQTELFDEVIEPGKRVKIMNWDKNEMEFFDKGVN